MELLPAYEKTLDICFACPNGGTFALYSLLCRHAKVKTIPNQHRTDEELTTYSRSTFHEHSYAAKTKRWLEKYASRKNALLILVLVGTCMVIGDGILTPAISERPKSLNKGCQYIITANLGFKAGSLVVRSSPSSLSQRKPQV
ncbi:unnamed protein product [Thlaspi arvense]|uniref:K+ potassium transporter integral membrane domain-containing protein n=1 Tax=Thlaspi arvense TaxID=13288 RepID=A0AAU9RT84_THLAR|nr:unnamed protein product [Thlaspi arvense]